MLKNFLKHILIMTALTVIIVMMMPYLKKFLEYLFQFYPVILFHLSHVFAGGKIGLLIKEVVAIVAIPLLVSAVISVIYFLMKRTWMPHIINTTWIFWVAVTAVIIVLRG